MNIENREKVSKPALELFVEAFGEANRLIMEFLEHKAVNAECEQRLCADGIKRNLISVSQGDFNQIASHEGVDGLFIEFFVGIDGRDPLKIPLLFKGEFKDRVSRSSGDLSDALDPDLLARLLKEPQMTILKPRPDPRPPVVSHGVPPLNVHRPKQQRPEARALFVGHKTRNCC